MQFQRRFHTASTHCGHWTMRFANDSFLCEAVV